MKYICDSCEKYPCSADETKLMLSCPAYSPKPKPITNADRIRSMTDEELADLLAKHGMVLEWNCNVDGIKTRVFSPTNPESKMLDWLKQEATDEDKSEKETSDSR